MRIKPYNKTVVLSPLGFLNILDSCSNKKYSFQNTKDFLFENETDILSKTIDLRKSDHSAILQLFTAHLKSIWPQLLIYKKKRNRE